MILERSFKLTAPTTIKYFMEKHGFRFSKSLGQNFLISEATVDNIISGAGVTSEDVILEIGPGIGVMTRSMAQVANRVVAIEIDRSLEPVLKDTLSDLDNVTVIFQDILKVDLEKLFEEHFEGRKPKVIANLPYYITTPIIMNFLENEVPVSDIVVMVQKEVAERIAAKPGTKEYGVLSLAVQYYCETRVLTKVPRGCFMPPPNVDSAVIELHIKEVQDVQAEDRALFFKTVRGAFSKRRKTIINAMVGEVPLGKEGLLSAMAEVGIDPIRRGETLNIHEFAALSNAIGRHIKNQ